MDAWFDGDSPRYFDMMSSRDSDHTRTSRHPLFSIVAFPPVKAAHILGIDNITAVRIVIAGVGSICVLMLFVLLRMLGCHRFDAALFSIVSAIAASSIFWFVVPETYIFGSASILGALLIVGLGELAMSSVWYVIGSALTLSFTITNWVAGIAATFVQFHWRKALQISLYAFCLVTFLWGIQKVIFPKAVFFLGIVPVGTSELVLSEKAGGPQAIVNSMVFHGMVMPAIEETERGNQRYLGPMMSIQHSAPGSGTLWGPIAVGAWAALLTLGLWGLFSLDGHFRLRVALTVTLLGLVAIHSIFNVEKFLSAPHIVPLLVIIAAMGTLTRARYLVLVLAGALVVTAGLNNVIQFEKARKFVSENLVTEHSAVREAMALRPGDPWPRSTGHVVLAIPGSSEVDKAYHEPGGSFSPAVGSFGVSIWITDPQGALLTTSDSIPMNLIDQQLVWHGKNNIPEILTESGSYRTVWSSAGPRKWELRLKPYLREEIKPVAVVRSVGPAGGPITSLDWNGRRLLINGRWMITITPAPLLVHVGEEGFEGWTTAKSVATHWSNGNGWGYARFELSGGHEWKLVMEDALYSKNDELDFQSSYPAVKSSIKLDLPDKRFGASLDAQIAHLNMGLVGSETRPGDPTYFPLAWIRAESYIVAALARAGQLRTAKQLSIHLAESDFLGGFGPEADSPGLAIWALEEVASRLAQREYDKWLWPHVRRKTDFILQMISADRPIYRSPSGPVIPAYRFDPNVPLVAASSKSGLTYGVTETTLRPLYVSAVNYLGLLNAAKLADRLNQSVDAERWRALALTLKKAWLTAAKTSMEAWTYNIWATGLWDSEPGTFIASLKGQSTKRFDERAELRKLYFRPDTSVAEAHQWLFFRREDRVWTILRSLWSHQASPGLYTWERNTGLKGGKTAFRRWERTRGWMNPANMTPDYQTAAEMLLLQLDMLAYLDEVAAEPTIVIGSGIPAAWLGVPMSVSGISTPVAQVDWTWDGREMRAKVRGCRCKVRLGPAFSPRATLHVEYLSQLRRSL